jgi:hypothetical protein
MIIETGSIVVDGFTIKPQAKEHLGHRIIILLSATHEAAAETRIMRRALWANCPELP